MTSNPDNLATQPQSPEQRATAIKLILMDCDGVLTDGRILIQPDGEEIKQFHVNDGQAITMAHSVGLRVGIISGRRSRALAARAAENHVDYIVQASTNKLATLQELATRANVTMEQIAFIGDDLPDIAAMQTVGLAIAVANAVDEVKKIAHLITIRHGGDGAVREAIELILRAQQRWPEVMARYSVK